MTQEATGGVSVTRVLSAVERMALEDLERRWHRAAGLNRLLLAAVGGGGHCRSSVEAWMMVREVVTSLLFVIMKFRTETQIFRGKLYLESVMVCV